MIVETAARPHEDTVNAFAANIRGRVLQPGHPDYHAARVVRNGLIDRRPALIVQCHGTADVVDSVDFARDHGLVLSVRGGGHNVAGNAVNDGGMVIDLSSMRSVSVDPGARRARVQGGATWGDVDRETQLWGLAVPGGQVSTTGVGGLSLHGGMGVLHRTYGLTIDSLVAVQIVTADGHVRIASARENPDLFWAVRGAGSNFGVATWFEFALHPVGPEIHQVVPLFSLDDAPAVLRKYRSFGASAHDAINPQAIFWSVPPIEDFPTELHGAPILVVQVLYAGDPDEGERLLRPVLDWATPIVDLGGRTRYSLAQSSFDPYFPVGGLYYWKSLLLRQATDEALDAIVDAAWERPSPQAMINLWQLGGAISRIAPDATAYVHRQAPYLLSFDTSWVDPADSDRCIAWTRQTWSTMHDRFGLGGAYLNFAGFGEEKDALVRASYGVNFERLAAIKAKYDPANLFRMNNNIRPAGRAATTE